MKLMAGTKNQHAYQTHSNISSAVPWSKQQCFMQKLSHAFIKSRFSQVIVNFSILNLQQLLFLSWTYWC